LDALTFYKKAIGVHELNNKHKTVEYADTLFQAARAYFYAGYYDECIEMMRRPLEVYEELKGKVAVETAKVLGILGKASLAKGSYDEALSSL
jgi:tetratricopeptide (TPR) repeat protein